MAIVFVNRTIGGKVKEAVVVQGTAGTEEVILRESLMSVDEKFLTAVSNTVVEGEPTPTLFEQLEVAVINDRPALDLFASRIKLTTELESKAIRRAVEADVVSAVLALADDVAAIV